MVSTSSRLFFALWPDEEEREAVLRFQQRLKPCLKQARFLPGERFHLTLHFLGHIPEAEAACCIEAASRVEGQKFELLLDQPGCFPQARVAWLGPSRIPDALNRLQRDLGQALAACGYQTQQAVYRPHVTLARKLRELPPLPKTTLDLLPIRWMVKDFVLAESRDGPQGVSYHLVRRFPLLRTEDQA